MSDDAAGGEFLDDRQNIATRPVATLAAGRDQQSPFEAGEILRAMRKQDAGLPRRDVTNAALDGPPQQRRLQVPIAEHVRGRTQDVPLDQTRAGPHFLPRLSPSSRRQL